MKKIAAAAVMFIMLCPGMKWGAAQGADPSRARPHGRPTARVRLFPPKAKALDRQTRSSGARAEIGTPAIRPGGHGGQTTPLGASAAGSDG